MIAPFRMTCRYISGEIGARSTTGIANIVQLFKRNEPRFGLSLGFPARDCSKSTRRIPRSMKTSTRVGQNQRVMREL